MLHKAEDDTVKCNECKNVSILGDRMHRHLSKLITEGKIVRLGAGKNDYREVQ